MIFYQSGYHGRFFILPLTLGTLLLWSIPARSEPTPAIISRQNVPSQEEKTEAEARISGIAQVPGAPRQFFLADTRLVPFEDSADLKRALLNSQLPTSSFNQPSTAERETFLAQNVSQGELSAEDIIPNNPVPNPETLTAQELLTQETIDRTISPQVPQPTLEQKTTPDPLGPSQPPAAPPSPPSFQQSGVRDLITTEAEDIKQEQEFTNAELFDTFEAINLGNYYDTIIAPLKEQLLQQAQQEPALTGTIPEQIEQIMTSAMSNTAVRYPWLINSSDNLSFRPQLFKPKDDHFYLNLDLVWQEDSPIINQISLGEFPRKEQFYWMLDRNRVVMETQGFQAGLVYQGKEQDLQLQQTMTLQQSLSGYQAVWVIPTDLQRLFKPEELQKFTIFSLSGQVTTPAGTEAGPVILDTSSIIGDGSNTVFLPNPSAPDQTISAGSTFSPQGGGALFSNLAVENAPLILQGFPTNNLQGLAGIDLRAGTKIPKEQLEAAGISFGDILNGAPGTFNLPVTSVPGIKIAQDGKFGNQDLLNILVNPYLTDAQRDYHYLNSIMWFSSGVLTPQFNTKTISQTYYDWYRFYFGVAYNRAMIQYSSDEVEATYFNLYSNPGGSVTFNYDGQGIDGTQTINSSIGLLAGMIFGFLNVEDLDESLDEAKAARDREEFFTPSDSKANNEEKRNIHQRLNTNLAYATYGSSLNQVSGFITFPSQVTPNESSIFQIKTGNLQRAVQFFNSNVETSQWTENDAFIAQARLSNRDFGPLTFLGNVLPVRPTYREGGQPQQPSNESFASQTILVSPDGRQYVQSFNPANLTTIPTTIKNFDLAFERLVLQKTYDRIIDNSYFNGYLYLPTVEMVYAGTSNDFNYSFNTGVWFNINNNSAPGVADNNLGIYEPWMGVYTNMLLSLSTSFYDVDENNRLTGITNHSPLLRFNWNSANNGNNPWQISLGYTISRQTQDFGLTLTTSLGVIPQYSNGPVIGVLAGEVGLPIGTAFNFNVELGDQVYYALDLLQRVFDSNFSIGPYVSNYISINQGFNSRELLLNYGGVIQHQFPDSPVTMTVQLGIDENSEFNASVKGGLRF
jgi:hypothetical protein